MTSDHTFDQRAIGTSSLSDKGRVKQEGFKGEVPLEGGYPHHYTINVKRQCL